MYTQCPECLSVFSLDARALAMAHGHVICGHCQAGFDSVATLAEQLPPEPFIELPVNEPALEPPLLDLVVYRPRAPEPVTVVAGETATTSEPATDFSGLVLAPRFAREKKPNKRDREKARPIRRSRERRWPWVLTCLALALLLACQLLWAERDALIRHPLVGSWLRGDCAVLHCRLPLVAAPEKIQLLASNVQAHPGVAGALMISARIRNTAAFAQPWPIITITLSDTHGHRAGMRRLRPEEYLDDHEALQRGLPAGASAVVLLEVADPGKNAVDFAFKFE